MDNKNYTMADLIQDYGFGFDTMNKYGAKEEPKQEIIVEQVEETVEEPKQKDITIKCKKCENEFIWTIKEQEFYKEKGFYRPAYCKECRKKIKVVNNFHKDM